MSSQFRKALIVGIDNYEEYPLKGCVNDAKKLTSLLEYNDNDEPNFDCETILAGEDEVTEASLKQAVESLFKDPAAFALFHFSGHGTINNLGGYLVTQDSRDYDEGLRMSDVIQLANKSPVSEILLILDCCHAGNLGNLPDVNNTAQLREGVSVLTAARDSQFAMEAEDEDAGVFSTLLASGLEGAAADILGNVTAGGLYAHVDQALGPWQQRPLFKAHLSSFATIRECKPAIARRDLRQLVEYFEKAGATKALDPSFEPTAEPKNEANEAAFARLQKMRAARLVEPVSEEHLYWEAMNSGGCRLTPLGQYYWRLVHSKRI